MKSKKMGYTVEDYQADNLQDQYTIMFGILGRRLVEDLGFEGERALREAVRRYGRDRGYKDRKKHKDAGCKINMYSAFNCGAGLPGNKRTFSFRFESKQDKHSSHVIACPMSDVWDYYDCFEIGRIYCEEFHFAYYNSYGFGKTRVNLATTLTERGADYCSFNISLYPAYLSDELKKECFGEYDTVREKMDESCFTKVSAQEGYRSLYLRLYYYILSTAVEYLGDEGRQCVIDALHELTTTVKEFIDTDSKQANIEYIDKNYPASMNVNNEKMWDEYDQYDAKEIFSKEFCGPLLQSFGIEEYV